MSGEDDFRPRPGRPGDQGRPRILRGAGNIRKVAARLGPVKARTGFRGSRIGRGHGAVPQARNRPRGLSARDMRRVTVKVHIARTGRRGAAGALAAHLRYVQRDGVERDGSGGQLYDRGRDIADAGAFRERCEGDRHQFRLIVSPEDAAELGDLKFFTRRLMTEMERDTGTRLDWVAVDHHNTGHPHTHIIIRGKDENGRDLVISPDYLMQGLRGRASSLMTEELGPRRELDILRAEQREATADRFTRNDRIIAGLASDGRVVVPAPDGSEGRSLKTALLRRLRHLEGLHLAIPAGTGEWQLREGWENTLKSLGRRGDIIRSLAAAREPGVEAGRVLFFADRAPEAAGVTGTVISQGPDDELRDRRFLLVQDFSGNVWHVSGAGIEPGELPPAGAVVEMSARRAAPRQADLVIADIAAQTGGIYSDALHAAADPGASAAFRLAHKRRLEALRMKGVVSRSPDGSWTIPPDFPERAASAGLSTERGAAIRVRSWMSLGAQITARAETWLDSAEARDAASGLEPARAARRAYLTRKGYLRDGETVLSQESRQNLRAAEMARAAAIEAAATGRKLADPAAAGRFEGRLERVLSLGQGRMVLIGTDAQFALVPWQRAMARFRGDSLVLSARPSGAGWTFGGGRSRTPEH